MSKIIKFNKEAKKGLLAGINTVNDAVKITIGPHGRNIALDKGFGAPVITNDGVSVTKEIILEDRVEAVGAEIIKEVANKTNDKVGDGTSTSVILTQSIFNAGLNILEKNENINVISLKNGIMRAAKDVVARLKERAVKFEDISQVATISAESEEIGKVIADTIKKLDNTAAAITVEESHVSGITSDVTTGMKLDKGYISPYMITDGDKMSAEYRKVPVLLTDKKLISVREMLPLMEKIMNSGVNELLIICDGMEGDALSTFVLNKLKGVFKVVAVEIPGFGNGKKELLQDISTVVGGKIFSDETGLSFNNADLTSLGIASKVVVTKDATIIVGNEDGKEEVKERAKMLLANADKTESKIDRRTLEERAARLMGGVAVIKVGAATDAETKYLKLKIEDAVNATKAAIEEGVVAGGGSALARISKEKRSGNEPMSSDEATGYYIVMDAIISPLKQILENAGINGALQDDMIKKIQDSEHVDSGYDAYNGVFVEDMIKRGIIDPVKVTRTAIENAASAASTLLTTDGVVVEKPIIKKE